MCITCFSRRRFLSVGSAAAATSLLAGCDEAPALVSDETVEEMGLKTWAQIRQSTPVSRNAGYNEILQTTAARLLTAAGESVGDWEVVAFAEPTVNAFALPGRKIGVYEGMFGVTENDAQLAAIVGHEIGHLQAEHGQQRISAQVAKNAGIRITAFLLNLGEVEYADEIAAALGVGVELGLMLPYSRNQELEADRLGLVAMHDAGYDARQAVRLWQLMGQVARRRPPEFLATHPASESRIREIEEMLPELT